MSSATARQYRAILKLSGQDMAGTHLTIEEAGRIIRLLIRGRKWIT